MQMTMVIRNSCPLYEYSNSEEQSFAVRRTRTQFTCIDSIGKVDKVSEKDNSDEEEENKMNSGIVTAVNMKRE